jgi:hypothetical protein
MQHYIWYSQFAIGYNVGFATYSSLFANVVVIIYRHTTHTQDLYCPFERFSSPRALHRGKALAVSEVTAPETTLSEQHIYTN